MRAYWQTDTYRWMYAQSEPRWRRGCWLLLFHLSRSPHAGLCWLTEGGVTNGRVSLFESQQDWWWEFRYIEESDPHQSTEYVIHRVQFHSKKKTKQFYSWLMYQMVRYPRNKYFTSSFFCLQMLILDFKLFSLIYVFVLGSETPQSDKGLYYKRLFDFHKISAFECQRVSMIKYP